MKSVRISRTPHDGMRDGTHIDILVCYKNNGHNYSGQLVRPAGFYLEAEPVAPSGVLVAHVPQASKRKMLFNSSRFSEKKMTKAVEMGKAEMQAFLNEILAEQLAA